MDHSALHRCNERRRRVAVRLRETSTLDLLPLLEAALKRMTPAQRQTARKLTLDEVARIELIQQDKLKTDCGNSR